MKSFFFRILLPALFLTQGLTAQQQTTRTIFLVRHADVASAAADAPLSSDGEQRAACLAGTLKDAGIKQIFVSDAKRTQQTADPLAQSLKLKPTVIPARDTNSLERNVIYGTSGNALVVASTETLNFLVQRLHAGPMQPIGPNEFDRLLVFTANEGIASPAASLHYCQTGGPVAPPASATSATPVRKPPTKKPAAPTTKKP
jgi:hypothetical protein